MVSWVPSVQTILAQQCTLYRHFNIHYASHAIGSIGQFRELWDAG